MSRWGGFRKGRKRVKNKKIIPVQVPAPVKAEDFSYADAEGIWNLQSTNEFSKKLKYVEYSAMSSYGGLSSTTLSTTMPSEAKRGDLAIWFLSSDGANTFTTPTGWTFIGGASGTQPATLTYYRIVQDGDPGTQFSTTVSTSRNYSASMIIFSANVELSNVDAYSVTYNAGASALSSSISSSTASGFAIALSHLVGRPPTQTPTLTMSTYNEILTNDGVSDNLTASNIKIGYRIFNQTNYQDISISTNDTGRQSLTGFYLVVS